jgi:hypothetical protein
MVLERDSSQMESFNSAYLCWAWNGLLYRTSRPLTDNYGATSHTRFRWGVLILFLQSFPDSWTARKLVSVSGGIIAQLTNSMQQNPSWEANSHSAAQENCCLLWNPKVHQCVLKSLHYLTLKVPAVIPRVPNYHFRMLVFLSSNW